MPSTPAHRTSSLPKVDLELEPQEARQLHPQNSREADEEFEMLLAKVGRAVIRSSQVPCMGGVINKFTLKATSHHIS